MIFKFQFRILIALVLFQLSGSAQQLFFPLDHDENAFVEMYLNTKESSFHTSVKPYLYQEVNEIVHLDSLDSTVTDTNRLYLLPTSKWAKALRWTENKLLDEDLIYVNQPDFKLRGNLLLGLGIGRDTETQEQAWQNTRGYWFSGQIGKKVFFESAFYENQARFLPFVNEFKRQNLVVPGQGRFKPFKEDQGADWAFASGAVGYKANKYFTAFVGHGRNFIGDGYRSLLLSDNAFNYPYFKLETNIWRLKYVNLWAQLSHIGFSPGAAGDRNWDQKYMKMHFLSWNINKRLNIGIYESVMWLKEDKGFDWQYANPVIFMRPVEWQNGSADNVMVGANFKYKITDRISTYGQLVLDDLNFSEFRKFNNYWGNKYGGQIGVKANQLFNVYGLSAQLEYNAVRPFTYSHFDSINAHTHMNQPLAHPMGANFHELIGFVRYKYKRHRFTLKVVWAEIGRDTANVNHGNNVFLSYNTNRAQIEDIDGLNGHTIGQGDLSTFNYIDARYGFMVNPRARLFFELGVIDRSLSSSVADASKTRYFYVGLRTTLNNFYYDAF